MADRHARDDGFALIEYIVAIAITTLIVGVLAAAVMIVFQNQNTANAHNDETNGSLGLTTYFPADVSSTPPGGRETDPSLTAGCYGYHDAGFNVLRLTWSSTASGPTAVDYRVDYRLVDQPTGAALMRVACDDTSGSYGAATVTQVAFGLSHAASSWTQGQAPAALSPASGDGPVTLTLTAISGNTYTVQGSRFNPGAHLDPSAPPPPNVALSTTMTLPSPNYSVAGQVLTYAVSISNTGDLPLTGVAPTYSNASAGLACAPVLGPGVTTTCTATHVVTQADLDAGSITVSLIAVGYYSIFTAGSVAVNTIAAAAAPGISATLSSSSPTYGTDNQVLTDTLSVTNTGNITVTDLTPSYTNALAVGTCAPLPLAPGTTATCTATHTVSAAEYTTTVADTATVTATTTNFGTTAPVTTAELDVAFSPNPQLAVTSFGATPSSYAHAGDALSVTMVVSNPGNVDLSALHLSYTRPVSSASCPTTIARGTSVVCTALYTATQDDIDQRSLSITATATGIWQASLASAVATVYAATTGTPAMSLLMSSTSTNYTAVGQVINYTLKVTNVGDVTLTVISPSYPSAVSTGTCSPLPLAPGATASCPASHTVTAAELGANLSASATATATTTSAGNARTVASSPVVINFLAQPSVRISSWTASPTPFTSISQAVTFTATVTNTGNVALTNLALAYTGATTATTCPTTLAYGASATCTATHTTTGTDSMAGFGATATATATYGTVVVSAQGSATVPSAVPCTVLSATSGAIGSPATVTLVTTEGRNKGYLSSDVAITVTTSALCTGLRIRYSPQSPNSVVHAMTETASGVWTYTIPGQGSTNPATWKRGSAAISILPPASISSTPLYTNSAGFTVS